jgi:hypothetical protein
MWVPDLENLEEAMSLWRDTSHWMDLQDGPNLNGYHWL